MWKRPWPRDTLDLDSSDDSLTVFDKIQNQN